MRLNKQLLNKPTAGWKSDLPLPQAPPDEPLLTLGSPPNYVDDTYLELHTSRLLNRSAVVFCAFGMLLTAFFMLKFIFLDDGGEAFTTQIFFLCL